MQKPVNFLPLKKIKKKRYKIQILSLIYIDHLINGLKPDWQDLRQVNNDMFETIRNFHNMFKEYPEFKIADIGAQKYFFYQGKDMLGRDIEFEFKENGRNVVVTDDNYQEYENLVTKCCLIDFCEKEYAKIKEGFNEVIPIDKLAIFSPQDLEKLISGIPEIDRNQFKSVCKMRGIRSEDQEAEWFWKYVNECSKEELIDIIRYFYGMSKLPAGGFSSINVEMLKLSQINTYPRASLCSGMVIKLPNYTKEQIFIGKCSRQLNQPKKIQVSWSIDDLSLSLSS